MVTGDTLMLPIPAGMKNAPMRAGLVILYCFPCKYMMAMRGVEYSNAS